MQKRLDLDQVTLLVPTLNEKEQRNTKGGGLWINGFYVTDDMMDMADEYAITPDLWDTIDWDALANGDYGGSDYGGGSGSGSGSGSGDGSDDSMTRAEQETIEDALKGSLSVIDLGVAASMNQAVNVLSDAQYLQFKTFGKSLGIVGSLWSGVDLVGNIYEEGHYDANDALATASLALGVAALLFPPAAIVLGGASFIVSIAVSTEWGDDIIIAGGGY